MKTIVIIVFEKIITNKDEMSTLFIHEYNIIIIFNV